MRGRTRISLLLGALVLTSVAASAQTTTAQPRPTAAAARPAATAAAKPVATPTDIRVQPERTTKVLAPTEAERAALSVLWKRGQAAGFMKTLVSSSKIDMAAVNGSAVPVLVLPSGPLASNLSVVATKDHYVASSGSADAGLVITGTRITTIVKGNFKLPPLDRRTAAFFATLQPAANDPAGIHDPVVSDTEDGVAVSFRRFGMVYDLRLSCARLNDLRCTPEAALKLATQTIVLGGGQ